MKRPDSKEYSELGLYLADCELYIDFLESKRPKTDEELRDKIADIIHVKYYHGERSKAMQLDITKILSLIQSKQDIVFPSLELKEERINKMTVYEILQMLESDLEEIRMRDLVIGAQDTINLLNEEK